MMSSEQKQALVSIGVPAYNGEAFLRESLDSILKQSYTNWECVISNNSSTDRTPEIAEEYCRADSRFRVVHTPELLPISENWNFTFLNRNTESKYFKILPADDLIYPSYLQEMVNVMEGDHDVGICTSYRLVDRKVRADGLNPAEGNVFDGKRILVAQLKREFDLTSSANAVLYRVEALNKTEAFPHIFQDKPYHNDTWLSYQLLSEFKLGFVFQVLSYTRRHEGTVTSTVTHSLDTPLYFWELALHRYMDLDPELSKVYRETRLKYTNLFLRSWFRTNRKVISWHKERLERPIRLSEYIHVLMRRLTFNRIK
ncbi:MAG: glycosyltransferase family 2 protein [Bacteroidetes bacterium]|nr:glycosyltransferase family 2 protein [Bacteroidota bacterium]